MRKLVLVVALLLNACAMGPKPQIAINIDPGIHLIRVWDCSSANAVFIGWAVNGERCNQLQYDGATSALDVLKMYLDARIDEIPNYEIKSQVKGYDYYRAFIRMKIWTVYDFQVEYKR